MLVALVAAAAGTAAGTDPSAAASAKKATKKKAKRIAKRELANRFPLGARGFRKRVVTREKIAAGAVATDKLRDGGVSSSRIDGGAVGERKLGARSARAEALGRLSVQRAERPVSAGAAGSALVACRAGERLISGGADTESTSDGDAWSLIRSRPSGNGWEAAAFNGGADEGTLIVRAVCLQAG